jgi:O-antigen ligase
VGAAAFALTAGTACDQGGFHPVSWDLPLVGLAALSLASLFLAAPPRPGRYAVAAVGALSFLALWTAASWLWSDSPPAALEESQRVALYAVAAAAVAIAGRRVPRAWLAGGVAAGIVPVACWNLASPGSNSSPVGYANGVAVLDALAILLFLGFASTRRALWLRAAAALPIVPLAWDLARQRSTGGEAALGAGLVVVALVAPWRGRRVPARLAVTAAALILATALVAAPFALHGHVRGSYWRVALHEYAAKPVLGSGAGTFVDWWTRIRTTPGSTEEAHSLYVETLAELGPVGLLAVLAALGVQLAAAFRLRRDPLGPALLAALVAFDVHAAVDFDWELAGVTLPAVLLGVSAAVHVDPPGAPMHARSRRVTGVVLVVVTVAAVLALAGNERLASAQSAEAAGRFPAAVADARDALRYAPWSADAWRVIGESLLVQGDRAGAAAAFRSSTSLDPNDWETWSELAGVSTGEPRRAAEAEAARLNPLAGR